MGVSTKVHVNFKIFTPTNIKVAKYFIEYINALGFTISKNILGNEFLNTKSDFNIDNWSMYTRFPFKTKKGSQRGVLSILI